MGQFKSILNFITRRRKVLEPELEQGLLRIGIISLMVVYLAARSRMPWHSTPRSAS